MILFPQSAPVPPLAALSGAALQLGFVVRNLEAAMMTWTRDFGVGPFIVVDRMGPLDADYDARRAGVIMSCGFSYMGAVQIELIQQINDVSSPYLDFLGAGREGLQHLGYLVEDYDSASGCLREAGCAERFRIRFGAGGKDAVYLDPPPFFGSMIELIESSPDRRMRNAWMQSLAAAWDGRDPVRRFASMADVTAAARAAVKA